MIHVLVHNYHSTGAQVSANITTDIIFDTEKLCGEYIVQNYDKLNETTNKKYNQHLSTPNLYHCVLVGITISGCTF